jgi:hypothetical protein
MIGVTLMRELRTPTGPARLVPEMLRPIPASQLRRGHVIREMWGPTGWEYAVQSVTPGETRIYATVLTREGATSQSTYRLDHRVMVVFYPAHGEAPDLPTEPVVITDVAPGEVIRRRGVEFLVSATEADTIGLPADLRTLTGRNERAATRLYLIDRSGTPHKVLAPNRCILGRVTQP